MAPTPRISATSFLLLLLGVATCYAHGEIKGECIHEDHEEHEHEYDRPMRIGAVFIVLVTSFAGALFPLITQRAWPNLDTIYFSCGKLFGAGVILSTAFVHMFPVANRYLTSPCLSDAFIKDFTAYAGLFALLAIVFVHFFQVAASVMVQDQLRAKRAAQVGLNNNSSKAVDGQTIETAIDQHGHGHGLHQHGAADSGHSHALIFDARVEKRVGVYILEAGIASHSIIIGIALGVEEEAFRTLLIAIVFHQFFEGIALSTVILESQMRSKIFIFLMLLFYSLTTPTGVAIGIGIHESYSDTDPTTLITQGVLDSVAAGILIYDSIVNIITPHFACPEFRSTTNIRRFIQFLSFWLGVTLMSILGIWA